jgi:hypothetical protein
VGRGSWSCAAKSRRVRLTMGVVSHAARTGRETGQGPLLFGNGRIPRQFSAIPLPTVVRRPSDTA